MESRDRDIHPVVASLELAAERASDLTPLVYARLFAEQPETEVLFWRDKNGQIRGEMLAKVFETILDFVGERQFAEHLIQTSLVVHTEYGVAEDVFPTFFGVVMRTVREVLGTNWSSDIDAAWRALLADLDRVVASAKLAA
jgi:hemoglobin-like flavoprotein